MTDSEIKQFYDTFEHKDMPFPEFKKQFRELSDPTKMQQDLAVIKQRRAQMIANKQKIDDVTF